MQDGTDSSENFALVQGEHPITNPNRLRHAQLFSTTVEALQDHSSGSENHAYAMQPSSLLTVGPLNRKPDWVDTLQCEHDVHNDMKDNHVAPMSSIEF